MRPFDAASHPRGRGRQAVHLGFVLGLVLSTIATGSAQKPSQIDLSGMDVEDLMNIKVSSVSKREQKLSQTAAAVFVIQQEDIRRSGATSIPDLLRMVPGLDVAQVNANTWAITSRGFNGQFSNKLLVLLDGRTVYDPSFAGVYWDVQDTVLEDIDRIEVIRGPGAAIWGSNAVNGVINITTKPAKHTQGGLLTGNVGEEEPSGSARYGGKIGAHAFFRAFGKYTDRPNSEPVSAQGMGDGSRMDRGGFRLDWAATDRNSGTVDGQMYSGRFDNPYRSIATPAGDLFPGNINTKVDGGDLLARWNHTFTGGSQLSLQTYVDHLSRVDPAYSDMRTTFDFDLRDHLTWGRHEIVWGFGYRRNWDRLSGSTGVRFTPEESHASIGNVFVQDEMTVVEDKLWLTLGVKLEHNVYTGVETEPTLSLMWAPSTRNSFWVSTAKASKIPARNSRDMTFDVSSFLTPQGQRGVVRLVGNRGFRSETVTAYEAGYRVGLTSRLWFDLTAFRNDYARLQTIESGVPYFETAAPAPYLVMPLIYGNRLYGHTLGAEGFAEWKATSFWTLTAGHTWFLPSLRLDPSSTDTFTRAQDQGSAPRNQFRVRSLLNLPHHFEWDVALYRVGRLGTGSIPAYHRLDMRLGWRAGVHLEVSVVGQNLLTPAHFEFNDEEQKVLASPIQRTVFGKLTWHF